VSENAPPTGPEPPRSITLPAGWVAEVVTHLEMTAAPALREAPRPERFRLTRIVPSVEDYRRRFRRVGAPWLWASRLRMAEAELAAILADRAVEVYDLHERTADAGAEPIGLLELDFRVAGQCELAFFGIVPEQIGTGAGRHLMSRAIERAWTHAPAIRRFHVHTCTNDHPAALAFYIRSGFAPHARSVEIYPDPRLAGHLQRSDAPHIPLLE
jgi:GNAT superfamily N-acetyltransferase